jgi:drug/metabolite transporter (DMT)-like permease
VGPTVSKLQVIVVILVATACVASGETLLSAGMKLVGREGHTGLRFALDAASNWRVLLGTGLMAIFFGLYSVCLSWADISFVLPFTAMSYLFVAFLARFALHEDVSLTRWIGALIIVLGVIVVGLGERR